MESIPMKIRKPYEKLDKTKTRRPVITINEEPSRTKQALAQDLDINNIVRKYTPADLRAQALEFDALYGDFTAAPAGGDYAQALNLLRDAENVVQALPSDIRAKFGNNPEAILNFLTSNDPSDIKMMVKHGLAFQEEIPTPQAPIQVEITNPTAT